MRSFFNNPMVDPAKVALIGYCFGGSTGAPLVANVSPGLLSDASANYGMDCAV